jgi:hypothetical protein
MTFSISVIVLKPISIALDVLKRRKRHDHFLNPLDGLEHHTRGNLAGDAALASTPCLTEMVMPEG